MRAEALWAKFTGDEKYFALERVLSLVDIEWHFVTVLRSVLRGAH